MPRIIRHSYFFLALATASLSSWGQTAPSSNNAAASGDFDILGLKLGMTAQEVTQVVQQHLKLSLSDMRMDVTPRHFQPGGTFVDVCVISNEQLEVSLEFTEVFPGKGTGPESLYRISYVPRTLFVEDRGDFSDRVLAKYGQPTTVRDKTRYVWFPREYRSTEEALHGGAAVLELNKSQPCLSLSNPAIRRRMEDAFHETQKVPL